jgi:hypothetical protein
MKHPLLAQAIFIVSLAAIIPGCATIVSKTSYLVSIRTEPKKAAIVITNRRGKEVYNGNSPAEVTLRSGGGYFTPAKYNVKIAAPGYEEKNIPIRFKLNGWYFGNIFLGGGIGMLIVDPLTGAMWRVVDPVINESLEAKKQSSSAIPELRIKTLNEISATEKQQLARVY